MPRTRTAAAPSPRGRKKTARPSPSQGWRTTDEEEIERRRQRAASEPLAIEALEPGHPVLGTFRVSSEAGSYDVEIRSLTQPDNSCGCPDYEVNGLGTCKHVEAVLAKVRTSRQARTAKPRIEVFLRRTGERPEVRAQGLERSGGSAPQALVSPLLHRRRRPAGRSAGPPPGPGPGPGRRSAAGPGGESGSPGTSSPGSRSSAAGPRGRPPANGSSPRSRTAGPPWTWSAPPLYPYQQEGMLHLAFTERALLADEMGLGKTVQAIAACELLRRLRGIERVLVVCPASLKGEWEEQIARFTGLPSRIIAGPRAQRLAQYSAHIAKAPSSISPTTSRSSRTATRCSAGSPRT